MDGQCHCGAVTVNVPDLPPKLNACGCSICRRYGALWGYYDPARVTVAGVTDSYVWGDRMIAFHRCKTCGVLTHWASTGDPYPKMGVNMQNFDQTALVDVSREDTHEN